jgi:hypothetical protein
LAERGLPKLHANDGGIPDPARLPVFRKTDSDAPKIRLGLRSADRNCANHSLCAQSQLRLVKLDGQLSNGLTIDSGQKHPDGEPIMMAKYTGLHALRHAAASLFIAHLGWTAKRVQVVMGHASITMTFDLYGHLFEDREGDRESMKKLEAAVAAA